MTSIPEYHYESFHCLITILTRYCIEALTEQPYSNLNTAKILTEMGLDSASEVDDRLVKEYVARVGSLAWGGGCFVETTQLMAVVDRLLAVRDKRSPVFDAGRVGHFHEDFVNKAVVELRRHGPVVRGRVAQYLRAMKMAILFKQPGHRSSQHTLAEFELIVDGRHAKCVMDMDLARKPLCLVGEPLVGCCRNDQYYEFALNGVNIEILPTMHPCGIAYPLNGNLMQQATMAFKDTQLGAFEKATKKGCFFMWFRQALEYGINHTIVDFAGYKAIATVFIIKMAATPAGKFVFRLTRGKSHSDAYTYVSEHFSDATGLVNHVRGLSSVRAGALRDISRNIGSLSELEELFLSANNSSLSRSC